MFDTAALSGLLAHLGIHHVGLFVLAGWTLALTPGPDVLHMVTSTLRGGWRAGVVAVAGISAGCLVHVIAATVGIGALVAASATAFTVLNWVGAAYLVYMGVRMMWSKPGAPNAETKTADPEQSAMRQVFVRGFGSNVLNPKVALFFLAFLPQFIDAHAPAPMLGFLVLGLLFTVNSLPVTLGYVALAAWLARHTDAVRRGLAWIERLAGAVFMGFGLRLALSDKPA